MWNTNPLNWAHASVKETQQRSSDVCSCLIHSVAALPLPWCCLSASMRVQECFLLFPLAVAESWQREIDLHSLSAQTVVLIARMDFWWLDG